jgi:hypothetical protein
MKEGTPLGARAQSAIQRAAVLYKPRLATFEFFNLTSSPDGDEWSTVRSGPLSRGYPLKRRSGGNHNTFGSFREEENLLTLPGIESQFVQTVAQ